MLRKPPDILITTPESLFLLLTSQGRDMLGSVRTLILDEVHAVAGTKRGAHLSLSVERLDRLVAEPVQRVGLSATQRPLEEIGRFVSGARPIRLVDAGTRKELDLQVVVPVEDMREPGADASGAAGLADDASASADRRAARGRGSPRPRSGRPSTPSCCGWSRSTARPSSSSTTAGSPSGWRCASTSWRRTRSRAPTTARWPGSSGSRSRSCSSAARSPAWWPPRRSSSASTWAQSIW